MEAQVHDQLGAWPPSGTVSSWQRAEARRKWEILLVLVSSFS